jgi:hypothetical protein
LAVSRPPKAIDYFATGNRLVHRAAIPGKASARVRDASGTSDQDGPEPGHLIEEARSERTEAGPSARTASERDREPARTAVIREGALGGWPKASRAGDLRTPCERQGGR